MGEVLELKFDKVIRLEVKYPWGITPWKVNIGLPSISLPDWHIPYLLTTIKKWILRWNHIFPEERTFARKFGFPSFIARVDYATTEETQELHVFEVEAVPAGIGIACQMVPGFQSRFYELGWPKKVLVVVSSKRINGGDDHLFAQVIRDNEWSGVTENFLFFRGLREPILFEWEQKSIVPPPFHQESKQYGEGWLWERVPREQIEREYNIKINKEKWLGIVIKGLESSRAEKIAICLSRRTRQQIEKWLGRDARIGIHGGPSGALARIPDSEVYLQRFYFPNKVVITTSVEKQHAYGIWRIYLGYSLLKKRWEILGGFLNLRASLLIHGATDSIFVPVYVPI